MLREESRRLNNSTKYARNSLIPAVNTIILLHVLYSCIQANRWRKRGLAVVPLKFSLRWNFAQYSVLVSVYASDGSVAVVHGGVELGQGINTKVYHHYNMILYQNCTCFLNTISVRLNQAGVFCFLLRLFMLLLTRHVTCAISTKHCNTDAPS